MTNPSAQAAPASDARLPGLDGLRAISVVWVVMFHLSHHQHALGTGWLAGVAHAGHFGVSVFFVISGFLITWLLLREERRTGTTNLSQFYLRRAFRILPAALFHLACVAVFMALMGRSSSALQWIACVFFFRNFALPAPAEGADGGILTAHFWSLSVEEQFYLFWPLVLRWLPGKWRLPVTCVGFLVAPFWKQCLIWHFGIGNLNYFRTDLHYHFILAGAALALARESHARDSLFTRKWPGPLVFICVSIGLALLWTGLPWRPVHVVLGGWWPAMAAALAIKWAVDGGDSVAHRMLNCRPMVWIGQLSYSIYLWQQFFTIEDHGRWWQRLPTNVCLILAFAVITHHLVEKPFLRLRNRLGPPAT